MTPQYRIQESSPNVWELDRAIADGWQFVGYFASEAAAQNKMADCIASDEWVAAPAQYFDALGKAQDAS